MNGVNIRKDKLVGIALAVLSFIFVFCKWFKMSVSASLLGQSYSQSKSFGILSDGLFDINTWLGLAKVVAIISIVLLVIYIASLFVDFKKFVPTIDFDKYIPIAYFGAMALALVLTLIGCISGLGSSATSGLGSLASALADISISPSVGWYLDLTVVAAGLVLEFVPTVKDKVLTTLKLK